MDEASIDELIRGAVSPGEHREECEHKFQELVVAYPCQVLQFLLGRVGAAGNSTVYSTMAHWCVGQESFYGKLDGESFKSVASMVMGMVNSPKLASDEGGLICGIVMRFVSWTLCLELWPGVLEVLCQMATSENELIAALGFEVLAEAVAQELVSDEGVIAACYQMAKDVLGGEYRHRVVGAVQMLTVINGIDKRECCDSVLRMLLACDSVQDLKRLAFDVPRLKKDFFLGRIANMMEVLWRLICDKSRPTQVRIRFLAFVCEIAEASYDVVDDYIPAIIPSLVDILTEYQGEDGDIEYLCDFANYFISVISKESEQSAIDRMFLAKVAEYMQNPNVAFRFAAFSCLKGIVGTLLVDDMKQTIPAIFAAIADPEPTCRSIGYKCIVKIATNFGKQMNDSLHRSIFPPIFDVIRRETVENVFENAFMAITASIRACDAEVVKTYAGNVMELCCTIWKSGSNNLKIKGMECAAALTKLLKQDAPFFADVAGVVTQMLQSNVPSVVFAGIKAVPSMLSCHNEASISVLCLKVFSAIYPQVSDQYTQIEQTRIFNAVAKVIKKGVPESVDVSGIIQKLMQGYMSIAGQGLSLEFQNELDFAEGYISIRFQTGYLVVSAEEVRTVGCALDGIANLISSFPAVCAAQIPECLEIMKQHMQNPFKTLIAGVYRCMDALLERHIDLGIPVCHLLEILQTNYSLPSLDVLTCKLIIKVINVAEPSQDVFQKTRDVALFLLQESRRRRSQMKAENVDNELIRRYDRENKVELWIARTFIAIFKRYIPSLDPGFVETISAMFNISEQDNSKMAVMTFWTERVIIQQRLIPELVTFCLHYFASKDPVERRCAVRCIGKLVKHVAVEPEVVREIMENLLAPLNDSDSDFSEANEEALLTYTRILDKYEFTRQPDILTTWLAHLPFPSSDHCVYVHRFFANMLRADPSFFFSESNAAQTKQVMDETYQSEMADPETLACYQEILAAHSQPCQL